MTRLIARDLSLGYAARAVVHHLDLDLPDQKITAVIGPNGCGKSTLLRGLARLLTPQSGAVLLDGAPIHTQPTRSVARRVSLLPQQPIVPEGVTVEELVARGRHPHRGLWQTQRPTDATAVRSALEATDTHPLADVPVSELSGGQRQRVWIALTLAQETDILLLDEPTTFLDLAHQIDMLDLIARLNSERGTTVVMVLHDLGLAARYADHLVALQDGVVAAQGRPAEVLTPTNLATVFGLDARVITDPESGTPLVIPRVTHHRRRPPAAAEELVS